MNKQLERPQVIDLVAIGEFEAVFDREQQALDDLQRRAHEAQHSAADFERQMAEEGIHPDAARWMMRQFSEFLRDLRAEAEEEIASILDHARRLAAAPRIPETLELSFHGALATRTARSTCDFIRWAPTQKPTVDRAPVAFERLVELEDAERFAAVPVATPDEPIVGLAPSAADPVSDAMLSEDDPDPAPFAGVEGDRPFWGDGDEPRSWWRRRIHLTAAAGLTVAAIVAAALAVAVQVI